MATVAAPLSEGPVLKLLRDRLRLLRKRRTRITQMEERVAQGQTLNRDQEEILKSKPVVTALIQELEDLRSAARPEDLSASVSAPEKPSLDGVAAAAGDDGVAAPEPVPESVTEPVPQTQLQIDAAATDSQQKDAVDVNAGGNITTAPQEEQKPETGGQQQNLKPKDGRSGYQNGRSRPGGRGSRGGYPNGRGYYHNNQYYPRSVEYQNRGQYYENEHYQGDFDYENGRGRYNDSRYYPRGGYPNDQGQYCNPGYPPRREYRNGVAEPKYYRNAEGEYNDPGYYSRNSYNTRGRGAGRAGGYANQGPNKGPNVSSAEQV